MSEVFYHMVVIALAALGVVKGFRRAFTGQVSSVLGVAFGIVSAHVLSPPLADWMRGHLDFIAHGPAAAFRLSFLPAATVFLAVFFFFRFLTKAIASAIAVFETGILDSLFGAFFRLLEYMLFVSIAFNAILCCFPESRLIRYARADDGNVVECVLLLAPALLGCADCLDLAHLLQLRDAKRISRNIFPRQHVIQYSNIPIENA